MVAATLAGVCSIVQGVVVEAAARGAEREELRQRVTAAVDTFRAVADELVLSFTAAGQSPEELWKFEKQLAEQGREMLRRILEETLNRVEPEPDALPKRLRHEGGDYSRKNQKSRQRQGIATSFGEIALWRTSYEPLREERAAGRKSIAPLLLRLGIVANNATPALAEIVGRDAADRTEGQALRDLQQRGVQWSPSTLRAVRAAVAVGVKEHLIAAQTEQIIAWIKEAARLGQVVISLGRDGIFLPMRGGKNEPQKKKPWQKAKGTKPRKKDAWKEAAVGTFSVFAKIRGKLRRLGTVYLGQMPCPLQLELTHDLNELIHSVGLQWDLSKAELVYVTDAGFHPCAYFDNALANLPNPLRPDKTLNWTRIVDFYHTSQRLWKLGAVLFKDDAAGKAWSRRMCHILKHEPNAIHRILHSAIALRSQRKLSKRQRETYEEDYNYLVKHRAGMDYFAYRKAGLPIGSGITEAACKTVFTQRFKSSGMTWGRTPAAHPDDFDLTDRTSGQTILTLRLATLSGVYPATFRRYLASPTTLAKTETRPTATPQTPQQTA